MYLVHRQHSTITTTRWTEATYKVEYNNKSYLLVQQKAQQQLSRGVCLGSIQIVCSNSEATLLLVSLSLPVSIPSFIHLLCVSLPNKKSKAHSFIEFEETFSTHPREYSETFSRRGNCHLPLCVWSFMWPQLAKWLGKFLSTYQSHVPLSSVYLYPIILTTPCHPNGFRTFPER